MDRHISSTMVGARVSWATSAQLTKIANDRGISVNALLVATIEAMVSDVRSEEGW